LGQGGQHGPLDVINPLNFSDLSGFNLRAELAANITEDIAGDDGAVYNPSLAWSLGFDRSLVAGIRATLQCNETIRLLDKNLSVV
jgi:hypothetical protein